MQPLNGLDWTAMVLLIIGGLDWGLVGLFSLDVVGVIFGDMTWFARLIYILVGASAVYVAVVTPALRRSADG